MEFDKLTTDDQKESIIALMVKVAFSDGEMHPSEAYFINEVGEKFGINSRKIESIIMSINDYKVEVPKAENERMIILYYLLFLIKFDGVITDEEVEWIKRIGFRFGFRDELTSDFIRLMQKYVDEVNVPPQAMADVIRKYKN